MFEESKARLIKRLFCSIQLVNIMKEIVLEKVLAQEIVTWGNWISDIDKDHEAVKIIEASDVFYVFVHVGRYIRYEQSSIKVYVFNNISRTDNEIPCCNPPCYKDSFICVALKKDDIVFRKQFDTILISYLKDLPPSDSLVIMEDDEDSRKIHCDIKRRTKCKAVSKQNAISCCRIVEGTLKKSYEGKYNVNLSLPEVNSQDLLI